MRKVVASQATNGGPMLTNKVLKDIENFINGYMNVNENILQASYAESFDMSKSKVEDLQEYINDNMEISFKLLLFKYIDNRGMTDAQVYKKAGVDRKLFSKIRSLQNYNPSKNTVIALSLALELDINEAEAILESVGYSLSYSDKFDLVVRYCFEKNIYDYMHVNEALEYFGVKLLNN